MGAPFTISIERMRGRIKVDALPLRTTTVFATPTRIGSFEDDVNMRVQCAELCGWGHASMRIPVRVISQADFDAWVLEQQGGGGPVSCAPAGTDLEITAKALAFDTDCLAAPANTPFKIRFENADVGVPHNIAAYTDESASEGLFKSEVITGPDTLTLDVPALGAGTYFFRCDVHPTTMTGTFIVGEQQSPAQSPAEELKVE